jgi:DNA replication ATP-dependent helicase Dna2
MLNEPTSATAPAGSEPVQQEEQVCFLCAYIGAGPCSQPVLEGRLISAYERTTESKGYSFLTLRTAHGLASVALTDYYRSFVKELVAGGKVLRSQQLFMRLYHLPAPISIKDYKGELLYRYVATSYTVAVLEPDTLLNITDLSQANYCSRQYLLHRLISSPPSTATIRGNLVHSCFKELLKYHDRGELMQARKASVQESPLAFLLEHLDAELQRSQIDLALAHITPEAMREEVVPHLESLAAWYQRERASLWDIPPSTENSITEEAVQQGNRVRAETFLLAPEIGLRGRLDLFWQQAGRQRLLELKTGGVRGDLPKQDHRWQVFGYHAQLAVRRTSRMKKAQATLVYSGTPTASQAYGIPFSIRELQRVCAMRNILVLSHITGIAATPPGPSKCSRCSLLMQCERVSSALGWQPPQLEIKADVQVSASHSNGDVLPALPEHPRPQDNKEDQDFFARYYRLLTIEGREAERQQALLWKERIAARKQRGVIIDDLLPQGEPQPTGQGEWLQTFSCDNQSELRKGDEILLSDGDPIRGEVVTGTIIDISANHVTVWTPELIAHPLLLDRYDNDLVHVRTLQNLMRWLDVDAHLRNLVAGRVRPRFSQHSTPTHPDFNTEQNLAIERALQMQDYLLIQGPPGTGKTSVIAEIVKRLVQQGQRVLLAAFTNQAVDNMLKRLDKEGFSDFVRLGHERSIDESEMIKSRLLKDLFDAQKANGPTPEAVVYRLLRNSSVVASTTATWSSDKYTPQPQQDRSNHPLSFDVAIIDEASQLTVPALLGALRFARRFILVGDEKQLPPLVLSKEAAEAGLSESLFAFLKRQNDDYMKHHQDEISACVPLLTQYRMNKWIANFASKVFYGGILQNGERNRNATLRFSREEQVLDTEPTAVKAAICPRHPLVFLNVIEDGIEQATIKSSSSEAQAIHAVVKGLLARGIAPQDIGIIAPYRAQMACLRHILMDESAKGVLTIDTVDRFQGGERSVIFISFATTSEPQGDLRDFLTNPNRLNVALTRAQHKLILVGHVPALERLPYFDRLITYCRSMKTLIPYPVPAHLA